MFQTIVKAKLTRNFIRIGAYILADLLKLFEGQLPQEIKVSSCFTFVYAV